jgi:hypothetical protein
VHQEQHWARQIPWQKLDAPSLLWWGISKIPEQQIYIIATATKLAFNCVKMKLFHTLIPLNKLLQVLDF